MNNPRLPRWQIELIEQHLEKELFEVRLHFNEELKASAIGDKKQGLNARAKYLHYQLRFQAQCSLLKVLGYKVEVDCGIVNVTPTELEEE